MVSKDEFHSYCQGKNIIVVGNGDTLLNEENGEFIDSHEIVLRMNKGYPREEFKKHVGSKTHIWSLSKGEQSFVNYWKYYTDIDYAINPWAHKTFRRINFLPTFNFPFTNFYEIYKIYHPEEERDINTFVKDLFTNISIEDPLPSTGCLILNYFIGNVDFQSLTIIGFDFLRGGNFYEDGYKHLSIHDPQKEEEYLIALTSRKNNVVWK